MAAVSKQDTQQPTEHEAVCQGPVFRLWLSSSLTFPSVMSHLALSQAYLILTLHLMKRRKKEEVEEEEEKKAGQEEEGLLNLNSPSRLCFSLGVFQHYLRNNIEGTIPVTMPGRERTRGSPSVYSKHDERTFQRLAPRLCRSTHTWATRGYWQTFGSRRRERGCRDRPGKELFQGRPRHFITFKPPQANSYPPHKVAAGDVFQSVYWMTSKYAVHLFTQTLRLINGSLIQGQRKPDS